MRCMPPTVVSSPLIVKSSSYLLQLSSLAIFFAGIYGWRNVVVDGLETRFEVGASVGITRQCWL